MDDEPPKSEGLIPLHYRRFIRPTRSPASSDSGGTSWYVLGFWVGLVGYLGATGYLYFGVVMGTMCEDASNSGFVPMILVNGGFVGLWALLRVTDHWLELWRGVRFFRGMLSAIAIVSVLQGAVLLIARRFV